jgi:hypothetical protein
MPHFTFITTIRGHFYLKQVEAPSVDVALREAIAALPFDDGEGPFDEELKWLQQVASGGIAVTLHPVKHCENTWLWLEGSKYEPQYLTYGVQTEIPTSG